MSNGMIISLVIWVIGMLFFCGAIIWHYKRQPNDRLTIWATSLIIIFWFIALLILLVAWIDVEYFSDGDD